LLLKATEGKGLSDSDVQKATKILLYAPSDIDIAARMISVYACLLECMFGANSSVVLAVNGWIPHIRANQADKRNNNGLPQDQRHGRPISNSDHPAKWKITDSREYGYFLKKLRDAPM
jgi:hypothetical protein